MSLLMDALRKAEEQKRKAERDAKSEAGAGKAGDAVAKSAAPALTLEPQTGEPPVQPAAENPVNPLEVPTWLGRAKRKTKHSIPDVELQLEEPDPVPLPEVEKTETFVAPEDLVTGQEPGLPGIETTQSVAAEAKVKEAPAPAINESKSTRSARVHKAAANRSQANAVFAAKLSVARQGERKRVIAVSALGSVLLVMVFGWMFLARDSGGGLQVSIDGYDPNLQTPPMPVPEAAVDAIALTSPQVIEPALETAAIADDPIPSPSAAPVGAVPVPIAESVAGGQISGITTSAELLPTLESIPAPEEQLPTQRTELAAPTVPQPEVALPERSITFVRRAAAPGIDPMITRAFSAYQAGNLEQARALYQEVLVVSPLHRDALLGLANIASLNGETLVARDFYNRLLTRDPADPVARAGMLELMPSGNPVQQELQLRQLLESHPQEASLAFALGNFLASQQRWPEAQQSYFDALQIARAAGSVAISPDYAFNLAVSLEHLGQPAAALSFYRQARELAALHPPSFDLAELEVKLDSADRGPVQ